MIRKTVGYDSSPALHIAAARVIELPPGTSLAKFLMVFLAIGLLFTAAVALCDAVEESCSTFGSALQFLLFITLEISTKPSDDLPFHILPLPSTAVPRLPWVSTSWCEV